MIRRVLYIISFLLLHFFLSAQQFYLKGEVKDEGGHLLQNVSIVQKSTGYLYHTGPSGSFGIISAREQDSLTLSKEGFERATVLAEAARMNQIILKRLKKSRGFKLASLTRNLQRELQEQWFVGDETYASIIENQFIAARQYPVTGLTLNVDRASYSNIRRFLNMDNRVPPDAVRVEEMLNYFNFDYTEPPPGKTFAIRSTLTQCPWNKDNLLLFANIASKKIALDSLPPSHLVFLIDISGSMDMPNRLPLLKSGFRSLVNNLRPIDSVSLVVYGGTVGTMLDATSGREKEKIFRAIDSLTPGGSTPGESGIKLAYSVARNHLIKNGNNRVILATDGDFNVGLRSEQDLEDMILSQREAGIYLTCLGIGMGNYKDSKIQTLAQKGNGNFAYIDSYAEAEKILLTEFTQTLYTVADDVFLNVQFNPDAVKDYRLIGFDNKVGAIKDTTSTIEGGEIGPAYSMMVAFEVTPAAAAAEDLKKGHGLDMASFRLEYKLPKTDSVQELVEKAPLWLTPFAKLQKCHQFAGAVIMFGALLRGSKHIKDTGFGDVLSLANGAADGTSFTQKEFITMVQQAKSIYSKKRKRE